MQRRLFHTGQEKIRIGGLVIKSGIKPVQGYNRTFAVDLRQAEDKL
jgi:hypothetical protein